MRQKGYWGQWALAVAAAVAIVAAVTGYETGLHGAGTAFIMHSLSDGFFMAAVLYIGFGLLMWIAESGNFYGLQYLGYSLVRIFSPRKDRFEDRKNFYEYCLEKKARQKESGASFMKWILLITGGVSLVLSLISAGFFYQLR